MVVPEVNKNILEELEAMGFPTAQATRALFYSGELFVKSERKSLLFWVQTLGMLFLHHLSIVNLSELSSQISIWIHNFTNVRAAEYG